MAEEPQTPTARTRRRKPSGAEEFGDIAVEASAAAAREAEAPRPPPTLPRMYLELEPRPAARADVPLFDYSADSIGLLSDFQVAWRLHVSIRLARASLPSRLPANAFVYGSQEGMLVDELEGGPARATVPRPVSLLELQAAIEAAAPPSPPPLREDSPCREDSPLPDASPTRRPLAASTPLPAPEAARQAEPGPGQAPAPGAVAVQRQRKRRSNIRVDEIFNGDVKIEFGEGEPSPLVVTTFL